MESLDNNLISISIFLQCIHISALLWDIYDLESLFFELNILYSGVLANMSDYEGGRYYGSVQMLVKQCDMGVPVQFLLFM